MPTGIYPHKPRTEATRKKLSLAFKGRVVSEQTRKKQSDAATKRFEDPESRIKQGLIRKGTHLSNEHRKKISDGNKGKLKGKPKSPLSEEHRFKISLAMKGRIRSPEYCKHISEGKLGKPRPDMVGENNPVWNGGTSFEPYCPKFNNEFRERVRAFFGYTCQKCGRMWHKGEPRLAVHHVNYQKDSCCSSGITPLFVPVCTGACHNTTNHNREYWEHYFTAIISEKYGGKCYFTKEEMMINV